MPNSHYKSKSETVRALLNHPKLGAEFFAAASLKPGSSGSRRVMTKFATVMRKHRQDGQGGDTGVTVSVPGGLPPINVTGQKEPLKLSSSGPLPAQGLDVINPPGMPALKLPSSVAPDVTDLVRGSALPSPLGETASVPTERAMPSESASAFRRATSPYRIDLYNPPKPTAAKITTSAGLQSRAKALGIPDYLFDSVVQAYGGNDDKVSAYLDAKQAGAPVLGPSGPTFGPVVPPAETKPEEDIAAGPSVTDQPEVPTPLSDGASAVQNAADKMATGDAESAADTINSSNKSSVLDYINSLVSQGNSGMFALQNLWKAIEAADAKNGNDALKTMYGPVKDAAIAGMSGDQFVWQTMMDKQSIWKALGVPKEVADQLPFDNLNDPQAYEKLWSVAESKNDLKAKEEAMNIAWSQGQQAPLAFEEYVASKDTYYKKLDKMINEIDAKAGDIAMADPISRSDWQRQRAYLSGLRDNVSVRYATYIDQAARRSRAAADFAVKNYDRAKASTDAMYQRLGTDYLTMKSQATKVLQAQWDQATGKRQALVDANNYEAELIKSANALLVQKAGQEYLKEPGKALESWKANPTGKTGTGSTTTKTSPYPTTAMKSFMSTDSGKKDVPDTLKDVTPERIATEMSARGTTDSTSAGEQWGTLLGDNAKYRIGKGEDPVEVFNEYNAKLGNPTEAVAKAISDQAGNTFFDRFNAAIVDYLESRKSEVAAAAEAAMSLVSDAKNGQKRFMETEGGVIPEWLANFIWSISQNLSEERAKDNTAIPEGNVEAIVADIATRLTKTPESPWYPQE